jgi:hypothetical protein
MENIEIKKIYEDEKKDYHKKFMEKNKDKINEKKICEICNGHYTYFNKSHHFKSNRHLNAIKIIEKYTVEYL